MEVKNAASANDVQAVLLKTVEQIASSPSFPSHDAQSELINSTSALVSQLRGISRKAHEDMRKGKRKVAESRVAVDNASLTLQNLKYQRRHLEEEISTCKDFRSIYQTIQLADLDQFKSRVPEEERSEEIIQNPHLLQLARLRFELNERKRLEAEKQLLQSQRSRLAEENNVKKARLEGLEADLKDMLGRSIRISKHFEDAKSAENALESSSNTTPSAQTPAETA